MIILKPNSPLVNQEPPRQALVVIVATRSDGSSDFDGLEKRSCVRAGYA